MPPEAPPPDNSIESNTAELDALLLEYGATPETMRLVKEVLARYGLNDAAEIRRCIDTYRSPADVHRTFPGFGGSYAKLRDLAAALEECKTSFRAHYEDHD